jgi:hypothetical protein
MQLARRQAAVQYRGTRLDMFQRIKQRSAIKSYVMKLSLELFSRLGKQPYYSIEQISKTSEAAGLKTDYLTYAHALFCDRANFRRHYKRTDLRDRYEALRDEVSKRYFGGVRDFNAANIIEGVRSLKMDAHFYESGIGNVLPPVA